MSARRTELAQEAVDTWNRCHVVGTPVRYWSIARRGDPTGQGATLEPARILGGSAVVRVRLSHRGGTDLIALSHVEPLECA